MTILKNLVAAMHVHTSRILIDDAIIPDLLGSDQLKFFTMMDIHMFTILNAKERTLAQWQLLFGAVDSRLSVIKVWEEEGAGLQGGRVIELALGGEA